LDAARSKILGSKDTIVHMVAFNGVVVVEGKEFKTMFGMEGFLASSRNVRGKMEKSVHMINK
jgi:hypothetical protein